MTTLLGGHIVWGADGHARAGKLHAFQDLGHAKVGQDRGKGAISPPILLDAEHDVGRLDVPMDDFTPVGIVQGSSHAL